MLNIKQKAFKMLVHNKAQDVQNWDELKEVLTELNYQCKSLNQGELFTEDELNEKIEKLKNGSCNPQVKHVGIVTTEFGDLINITLSTDEDEEPYDLNSEDGVFGYVWNLSDDWCSEYGYAFYQNDVRIG